MMKFTLLLHQSILWTWLPQLKSYGSLMSSALRFLPHFSFRFLQECQCLAFHPYWPALSSLSILWYSLQKLCPSSEAFHLNSWHVCHSSDPPIGSIINAVSYDGKCTYEVERTGVSSPWLPIWPCLQPWSLMTVWLLKSYLHYWKLHSAHHKWKFESWILSIASSVMQCQNYLTTALLLCTCASCCAFAQQLLESLPSLSEKETELHSNIFTLV